MKKTFGSALRDQRRAIGISQRELAEKASLDFSYISKLENDRLPPPAADTIVTLCRILGSAPDDLLAMTGKIPSKVRETVSATPGAQEFLRVAQRLQLSDTEWRRLTKSIRRLRGEPR